MKKLFLLVIGFIFSVAMIAQGNKGGNKSGNNKGNDNAKNEQSANPKTSAERTKELNDRKEKDKHDKKVWAGTSYKKNGAAQSSKNQPAKVRDAFQRDYPNGGNVTWSKYRGDWTATFNNGPFLSTAVYHANGERKDTRTAVTRNDVPANVLDSIFKRRPAITFGDIIRIELPNVVNNIFRFKETLQGKTSYFYYNSNGQLVKYNY